MNFTSWLDERFTHDVSARNPTVEQACFDHFKESHLLNIVDIGSGTGSTFLALYHKIQIDQVWTFLEQDAELILHSKQRIVNQLTQEGFQIEQSDKVITFRKKGHKITLKTINESIVNIDKVINLEKVDLVTASAIFDLFSIEQYIEFDKVLKENKVGILSVMNYTDMRFIPEDVMDKECISTYHDHMCRKQHFGVGMGPNCRKEIVSYYNSTNRQFTQGESLWMLDSKAVTMHSFILEYMDQGIHDMPVVPENFDLWLNNKKSTSKNGELVIEVDHFDYFVV